MKTLSISDVKSRLSHIPTGQPSGTKANSFDEQATKAIDSGVAQRIVFVIENGVMDPTRSMRESTMYNLLEALVEYGSESEADKYANRIMKEYVSRTRNAKETQTYLKQKLGRAKSKMFTKPKDNLDDIKNAINGAIGAAKKNYDINMTKMKDTVTALTPNRKRKRVKEEAIVGYYEEMVNYATSLVGIDRILENYNRVSKRFNLDRIIQENTPINGVADTAVEICNLIETYDMPIKARYNTCLETVWYGLHKNSFQFNIQEAVTAVTDFYTAKGGNSFACKSILEASVVFDKDDYRGDIDVITEEEPEDEFKKESADLSMDYMVEGKLSSEQRKNIKDSDYGLPSQRKYPMPDAKHVRSAVQMFNHCPEKDQAELARNIKKKLRAYNMTVNVGKENNFSKYYKGGDEKRVIDASIKEALSMSTLEEATLETTFYNEAEKMEDYSSKPDFNKILAKFRASNDEHKENKLQALVRTLYSKSTNNIVEETPSFFSYLRGAFILGSIAIHPVVAAVLLLCDQVVRISMERDETEKMMAAIKNEIKAVDKKMESVKDEDKKKALKEYRDALVKGYSKVSDYHVSLLNDEEQDEFYDKQDDSDILGSDGGDEFDDLMGDFDMGDEDFGDDDFSDEDLDDLEDFDDEDFKEAAGALYLLSGMTALVEGCPEKCFDQGMCHKMLASQPSLVGDFEKIAGEFPTIIDRNDLRRAIDDVRSDMQIGNVHISYVDRHAMSEAYDRLARWYKPHKTSNVFVESYRMADYVRILQGLNTIYGACMYRSPMTEASFTNSIKIASQKVQKALKNLSDKERTMSKNIDVAANNFSKAAQKAMTNDRREGVIKGSVIPSASRVLKGAIATAGLILIDPVLAVIGVIGYIAVSKKLNDKERQYVLDEINVELKMCDKYIELAEGKNDMKALRQLYTIQKELQKQKARIILKTGMGGKRTADEVMARNGLGGKD